MAKGDFITYIVSDNPNAYPDGGEQGGYWYERVGEIDPTLFGCTKYAVDKFNPVSRTATNALTISHSLGEKPKMVIITTTSDLSSADLIYASYINTPPNNDYLKGVAVVVGTSGLSSSLSNISSSYFSDTELTVQISSYYYAPVEYTLITIA